MANPGESERADVLVVEYDQTERDRMAACLEDAGFGVLTCPGPTEPDYVCLAGRDEPCPLMEGASVVVLNMRLAGDTVLAGTPGWQVLLAYVTRGRKVVALVGEDDPVRPFSDQDVAVLARPAGTEALVEAVRSLAG